MNTKGIASQTLQKQTNDMYDCRHSLRLTKQEANLLDILQDINNTANLICLFSHWGIKRDDTGKTVSFVKCLYTKGDIIPRNELVIRNIDHWLLHNPLKRLQN